MHCATRSIRKRFQIDIIAPVKVNKVKILKGGN